MKKQKNGKNDIKFGDTIPIYFSFTAVLMILGSCFNTFYVGVFSENPMGLIRGLPRI